MNTFCQLGAGGAEKEAILEPIISVGFRSEEGSRMTRGTMVGVEGGPEGTSLGRLEDSVVSRGLLRPQGAGGGGASC